MPFTSSYPFSSLFSIALAQSPSWEGERLGLIWVDDHFFARRSSPGKRSDIVVDSVMGYLLFRFSVTVRIGCSVGGLMGWFFGIVYQFLKQNCEI